MQQLLDKLKAADKAYTANIGRETYKAVRAAAEHLYNAIWDSLVDGKTVRITGQSYFQVHEIRPTYTETISIGGDGWVWYVDSVKNVHSFSMSAADKVAVVNG